MSVVTDNIEHMFDIPHDAIPPRPDSMTPGPALDGFLSAIDVSRLSGHDRVAVLRAHQRMPSHYTAKVFEDMMSVADAIEDSGLDGFEVGEAAAAEIRAARADPQSCGQRSRFRFRSSEDGSPRSSPRPVARWRIARNRTRRTRGRWPTCRRCSTQG